MLDNAELVQTLEETKQKAEEVCGIPIFLMRTYFVIIV